MWNLRGYFNFTDLTPHANAYPYSKIPLLSGVFCTTPARLLSQ